MRRLLGVLVFSAVIAIPLYSQESGPQHEAALEDRLAGWKLANFAILVVGLGYLIAKSAPAFFNARSDEIQRAIKDATGLKIDAEFRSSEMDRRMATLSAEVQKLRDEAKAEMERESARIDEETRNALARIQEHTTREIEALRYQASLSVRDNAIQFATNLAVAQLRDHPERADQDHLIHAFSRDLLEGSNGR
jgi:F0F1-type ATP synthase membrane subunit b/b'